MTYCKQNYVFSDDNYDDCIASLSIFDNFTHAELDALFNSCDLVLRFIRKAIKIEDVFQSKQDDNEFILYLEMIKDEMCNNISHRVEEINQSEETVRLRDYFRSHFVE